MQDDTWSWVGEDGVEHHGSETQLAAALSAQRLAAYTLVTKRTWRDWLPAMAVAELQAVLPLTSRDVARQPTLRHHEPKLPPPMHEYPALRLRHQGLTQGATPVPSRPRSSIPSSPHLELSHYANDEFDEPTVQIDAEELERALNESRVDDAPVTPRSGAHAERPDRDGPPLPHHDVKRRALAQRLAQKMPTYPGYIVNPSTTPASAPPPSSPMSGAPMTPPSVPSAPSPPFGSARFDSAPQHTPPPPMFQAPSAETAAAFGANEPTLTSRLVDDDGPRGGMRKLWLGLVALAGTLAGAAWFATQRTDAEPPPAVLPQPTSAAPLKLPAGEGETKPHVPVCSVEKQAQLSEFAHAQVRPALLSTSTGKLAVGFAQTGRIAAGIVVDPASLSVERVFSDNQTSPLWSVTPIANQAELKFRVSRAASTLRSTVTLTTQPPLFFGLNREGLSVRGDADLIDRMVWKSEWDTISLPDVAALGADVSLIALRAGGERGKILVGKIGANGQALGELTAVPTGPTRVEAPSLLVGPERIFVTYAAGDKPQRDRIFIAASARSSLPTAANEVLRVEQGIAAPTLARIGADAFALQYTRGIAGKQEVLVTILNRELEPQGEPLLVSPPGRDAYEGGAFDQAGTLLGVYFVRQEFGHELWASKLTCK